MVVKKLVFDFSAESEYPQFYFNHQHFPKFRGSTLVMYKKIWLLLCQNLRPKNCCFFENLAVIFKRLLPLILGTSF